MKILKTNKKILTGIFAFAFSASLTAGLAVATTDVNADNATLQAQASSFAIMEGAAVRLSEPYGIRYTATISKDNFDAIASAYASVEYGVLICPTDLLTGKTLDFDVSDGLVPESAGEGEVEFGFVEATPVLDEATNVYTIKGSLVGIQESNLSRPFTGKAYVKATDAEGNVSYAYTGEESRAIYTVATYAVNDPDEETQATLDKVVEGATETPREYLNSIIDKVQSVYGNPEITVTSSNPETAEYNILNGGDQITVSAKVSKTVNGVTRTLDACPTITADGDSGITLEQISATQYIVKGTNKSGYNLNATLGVGENKLEAAVFEENVSSWQQKITPADTGVPYVGGTNATLTLVEDEESEFNGAYHWTGSKYIGIQPSATKNFKAGDRFTFDVYANDGLLIAVTWANASDVDLWNRHNYANCGVIQNASGEDVFSFRTLETATGKQITQGPGNFKSQWLTYEFTILKESDVSNFNILYYEIAGSYAVANGLYIRNMELLKYSTNATVSLADGVEIDESKTYDYLTPINVGALAVTDERGVTKTLPATATGGYIEDGVLYTGLGEQKITIKAEGFDGGLEYTIQGGTKGVILDGEETKKNLMLGANASLTYEKMYSLNQNAWVANNNGVDDQYNDPSHAASNWHEMSDGFTFTNMVASSVKANTYLYVEVYAPQSFALSYYNNAIRLTYSGTSGGQWTFYNADGQTFEAGNSLGNGNEKCKNQWVTLELKVTSDWNVQTDGLSALNSQFDGQLRFGKITLSTEKINNPVVDLDTEISFLENESYASYVTLGKAASLVKSTDEGFTDAHYYTVTDHSQGNEPRSFGNMPVSTKTKLIQNGAYIYLSVYKPDSFLLCLMGCGDAHYLYNATSGSSDKSGISWQMYVYDENGVPQKATTASVTNAWITYEFKFSEASVANAATQAFYFFKLPNTGSDKDYGVYVKDFIWSKTQMTAFANVQ